MCVVTGSANPPPLGARHRCPWELGLLFVTAGSPIASDSCCGVVVVFWPRSLCVSLRVCVCVCVSAAGKASSPRSSGSRRTADARGTKFTTSLWRKVLSLLNTKGRVLPTLRSMRTKSTFLLPGWNETVTQSCLWNGSRKHNPSGCSWVASVLDFSTRFLRHVNSGLPCGRYKAVECQVSFSRNTLVTFKLSLKVL